MRAKILCISALFLALSGAAQAGDYIVTITNMMDEELLAPVLIAPAKSDDEIFKDGYVSSEAEHQILTGDPAMLKERIGKYATVGHGTDGPPGVLLAPGKSLAIPVSGKRKTVVRVLAMVAPTMKPDHFVSAVINLESGLAVSLDRYDIGHDEGRKLTRHIAGGAALVTVR